MIYTLKKDLEPVCCFSGFTTLDLCGCCKTCTKKRGDRCGRVWMLEGKCGPDDVCLQMLPRNGMYDIFKYLILLAYKNDVSLNTKHSCFNSKLLHLIGKVEPKLK